MTGVVITSPVTPTSAPRSTSRFQAAGRFSPTLPSEIMVRISPVPSRELAKPLAANAGQHHTPGDHLTGGRVRRKIAVPRVQLSCSRGSLKATE